METHTRRSRSGVTWRDALFIAAKDLKYTLHARETLMWVFVMPILFFWFIGSITGNPKMSGSAVEKLALWSDGNAQGDLLFDRLVRRLEDRNYEIVRPESEQELSEWTRRLRVPAGFSDSVLAGTPVKLQFDRMSGGEQFDYDAVRIGRAIYTVLADVIVSAELGEPPTAAGFARLDSIPRALGVDVRPAGRRRHIPSGFEQAIPGILVMFTMMIMTTSGAVLLVIERQQGLLRRLAYTPISKQSIVAGKWAGKLAVGMVQIVFGMIVGTVVFKMNWGTNLAFVSLLMFVYAGFMASLGVLLGTLARSEGQAVAIGVVSTNALAALGGCWWPVEILSPWLQDLQLVFPTGWAMDGLHKLVSFAAPPASVAPHLVGMALGCVILMSVAARIFRFE